MFRAKKKFDSRSFLRVLVVLIACSEVSSLAIAAPARFWFSLDKNDPYRFSSEQSSASSPDPGVPKLELIPGATEKLYLWARARTTTMDPPDNLLNISLNVVVPDLAMYPNLVDFENVEIANPKVIVDPMNSDNDRDRFGFVIDSENELPTFTNGFFDDDGNFVITETTTFPRNPPMLPFHLPQAKAGIERFAAFTLSQPVPDIGIGHVCVAMDDTCFGSGSELAWRLAELEVSVDVNEMLGSTHAWLQVGSLGITHAVESNTTTLVTFGDPSGHEYNTTTERDMNVSPLIDSHDIDFNVKTRWSADYDGIGIHSTVSGSDFLIWQRNKSDSPIPSGTSGDGNNDMMVDSLDLEIWKWQYGKTVAPMSGISSPLAIPEPSTYLLATIAACVAICRHGRQCQRLALALALLGCLVTPGTTQAAQLSADWLGGTGLWTEASLWSTTNFPDNGADDYDAKIDTTGAPYAVTLNTDVTVDSLTIDSADASLDITGNSTLAIGQTLALSNGTLQLNDGRLSGGTLTQGVGANLAFTGTDNRLIGVALQDGLTVNDFGQVRLQSGTTIAGTTTLGEGSVLAIDDNITFDNQTIVLNDGFIGSDTVLGIVGNNTLTIGANAQIDMNMTSMIVSDLYDSGVGTLINEGTINIPVGGGGAGRRWISPDVFDNRGTVNVNAGWLQLRGLTTAWSNTGSINVAAGSTVQIIGGTITSTGLGLIDNTASATGGEVAFVSVTIDNSGSTFAFSDLTTGSYHANSLTINGGTLTQTGGARLVFDLGNRLNGVSVEGGLDLITRNNSTVRLQNGSTFTGTATIGSATLIVEDNLTFADQTFDLIGKNGTGGTLGVAGDNTMTLGPAATVNLGSDAILSSDLITAGTGLIVNEGLVKVTDVGSSAQITADNFDNRGRIDLASNSTLTVSGSFTHADSAVLSGTGTLAIPSFVNEATVSPGNSPGIITVDGDYIQTSDGVLEIEVGGTTPGTQHDQLIVTGNATLAGALELPIINGYVPVAGQSVTILSGGTVSGAFESAHATNLPSNVAYTIAYNASDVDIQFVAPTDTDLDLVGVTPAQWANSNTWTLAVPDSTTRVDLSNNGGDAGTVRVLPPGGGLINAAHSVAVGGGTDQIQLFVEGTTLSVSTATSIINNGTIALSGGGMLIAQTVSVSGGGQLSGTGTVVGNTEVGVLGGGPATFDPVGNFTIDGDYTQGSDGVLSIKLEGAPGDPLNDTITVTGDVSLSGTLEIDVSDLLDVDFSSVNEFVVFSSLNEIEGNLPDIILTGRDDLYGRFTKKKGGLGIPAELLAITGHRGDADNENGVDDFDAEVFARVLINNDLQYYKKGNTELFGSLINVFNFDSSPASQGIDFLDIPGFAQALADSGGISALEAYNQVEAAIAAALEGNPVPEPSGIVLSLTAALFSQGFRRRFR